MVISRIPLREYILKCVRSVWNQPTPIPEQASIESLLENAKYDKKTKKADFLKAIDLLKAQGEVYIDRDIVKIRKF